MVKTIELSRDPIGRWPDGGPAGDQSNMRFQGFDGDDPVVVDVGLAEWDLIQRAHDDIDGAITALERLAKTGASRRSERGFGRVVHVTLPKS